MLKSSMHNTGPMDVGSVPVFDHTIKPKAVSRDTCRLLAGSVVREFGKPSWYQDVIMYILDHENIPQMVDGKPGYFVEMAYPFRGLGQFSDVTWKSLTRLAPDLVPRGTSAIGNPLSDIKAIVALIDDSIAVHKRTWGFGVKDAKIIYLYHQQGAGGAEHFLTTGSLVEPVQSKRSIAAFKEIDRGPYSQSSIIA